MPLRLNVFLPALNNIVETSNAQHAAKHHRRPVHVLCIGWNGDGEERCHSSHHHVDDREGVNWGSKLAKREPSWWQRFFAETFAEDACDAEGVAEAGCAGQEGDDGVERCGGAEVD